MMYDNERYPARPCVSGHVFCKWRAADDALINHYSVGLPRHLGLAPEIDFVARHFLVAIQHDQGRTALTIR